MRDLIIKSLREAVKAYPEIMDYLEGDARLMAVCYSYKIGEAPDDDARNKDERKLRRAFASFLNGQQERVIEQIHNSFLKSIYQMSFWSDEESKMWDEMSGVLIDIILHGVDGAIDLLPEEGVDFINTTAIRNKVIERAMKYRQKWIKTVTDSTMKNVWQRIESWKETGDPLEKLIELLREDPLLFDEVRARRFAITETTRLNALGHQMTYEESGYIKEFKWQTANDELVCAICGPNNGKRFPVSELGNLIPAHPNCRCWDTPVVDVEAFGETLDFTPEPGEWY